MSLKNITLTNMTNYKTKMTNDKRQETADSI